MDVPFQFRQRGVTLIETLVAVVVMSIGLLGIATLFLSSLRDTGSAMWRTRAITLSEDIIERMRANRSEAARYDSGVTPTGQNHDCAATADMTVPASCSPQQLAEQDIHEWRARVTDSVIGLPSGVARITVSGGTPADVTVFVQWTEGVQNDQPLLQKFELRTQL